jgi:hypothetical protein
MRCELETERKLAMSEEIARGVQIISTLLDARAFTASTPNNS